MRYSVIVPVFNRPEEVDEFLESLVSQTFKNFDVVIVEDGSDQDCRSVVEKYNNQLDIDYFFKENSGPGDSRNYGMAKAKGSYFLIFDSDCILPKEYMEEVDSELNEEFVHCFGGPDAAHESFSDLQKAINYSMTSFLTTGGIRGRSNSVTRFQPRSFNMGVSKELFEKTGGFGDIHPGEDPDLSLRIWGLGYATRLFPKAHVFHKRRISFEKFKIQVRKFGLVRPILNKWHKKSGKLVFWLPTLFTGFVFFSCLLAIVVNWRFILPLGCYLLILFLDSLRHTKNLKIAWLSIWTSLIQLIYYGVGFAESQLKLNVLGRDERQAFPKLFFDVR